MGLWKVFRRGFKKDYNSNDEKKETIKLNNNSNLETNDTYIENNYQLNNIDYKSLPEKSTKIADVIMLYNFKNNPSTISDNINDYVQYFVYRYNVNPIKLSRRLVKENYLSLGINDTNKYEFISSLKNEKLKAILKNKNLKCGGKKNILVDRIIENYTLDELLNLFPYANELYYLTDKGLRLITENQDLIKLHQTYSNYMIEYEDYIKAKHSINSNNFEETCLEIFKMREQNHIINKNWGLLRNTYFNIYGILKKVGENEQACEYLIKSIYIDLSGMYNNNLVSELHNSNLCWSKFFKKEKEFYQEEYVDLCLNIPLPFHYFNIKNIKSILTDIITKENINIDDYKKVMNKPKENQKNYTYFKF